MHERFKAASRSGPGVHHLGWQETKSIMALTEMRHVGNFSGVMASPDMNPESAKTGWGDTFGGTPPL